MIRLLISPLRLLALAGALLIFAKAFPAQAQTQTAGALDSGFDPNPNAGVSAIAVQPDGGILIGGFFTIVGDQPRNGLARLNADGSVQPLSAFNFGTGLNEGGGIHSIVIQPDGKILIGGRFNSVNGQPRNGLARLNPNGSLESTATFNIGSGIGGSSGRFVSSLALQPDGRILVGGEFDTFNGQPRQNIARLNPDGSVESTTTFNPGGGPENRVNSIALQPDGKILIAGIFTAVDGQERNGVARLNANGSHDVATFDPLAIRPESYASSVVLQPDGKILVAGFLREIIDGSGPARLVRLNPDGTLDSAPAFTPVNSDGGDITSVALQADGKIIVAGSFNDINGTFISHVARLTPGGLPESDALFSFPGVGGFGVEAVALQANGRILIGGLFESVGTAPRSGLARLINDAAIQELTVPDRTLARWNRSGAAPELGQVIFELSADNGDSWTPLGAGTRVAGGWELAGLDLPSFGQLRARGRASGGIANGSSSLVEQVAEFFFPEPEIAVEQPANSTLDLGESRDFGAVQTGAARELVFVVRNNGTAELTGVGVTVEGADAAAFTVTDPPDAVVNTDGGFTEFTVRFAPAQARVYEAVLLVASNDPDTNSFNIPLTGTGAPPPSVSFAQASSSAGENAESRSLLVQLSAPGALDVTVPFTVGGTASGQDVSVSSAPLVIPAGSSSGFITVNISNDNLFEGDETVVITLGTPQNATSGNTLTHTLTITDNEQPPVVAFTEAASKADENAGALNVALSLSGPSAFPVSVPFTLGGTAVAGTDFTAPSSPLVIPAGATSANLTITFLDDPTDEPDETVILTLGTPAGAVAGTPSVHTLTIADNDAPPVVSFAAATSTAAENAGSAQIAVNLSAASAFEVSVPFTVSGTASAADATVSASPLVIPAGATSGTLTVTLTDDDIFEGSETVLLTLGAPVNATAGTPAQHTLNITDDEGQPVVSFVAASSIASEADGAQNVAVSLSGPSAFPVTVPFTVGGTATAGVDFTAPTSPLTIPAGVTSRSLTVTLSDDNLFEGEETIILTLGTPVNATTGTSSEHTLVILDTTPPPVVSFTAATATVEESAGSAQVTVNLSAASAFDVTVPFTVSGTASAQDFTAPSSPLTISAGATTAVLSIAIQNDSLNEPDETVILTLGQPDGAGLGNITTHTLTIADNDTQPVVAFAATTSTAAENAGSAQITVSLSAASAFDVTVPFTLSGTADAADATVAASPLVVPAGATSGAITVTLINDNVFEGNETLILTLGTPVNATAGTPATHTLTITDDESQPVVAFAAATSAANENAGTVPITLTLSAPSASPVSVPYTITGTATAGADFTAPSSPLTIPAGATTATLSLPILDDLLDEPDETVVLTLGTPLGAVAGTPATHTLTIFDDEGQPVVSFAAATSSAAEDAGGAQITVNLSAASSFDVTVPFTIEGTATAGNDFTAPASPLVIPAGATSGTLTVTLADDNLFEGDETLILTLGTPVNASAVTPAQHTLTIRDNDAQPVVAFAAATSTAAENVGTLEINVTLSGPSATAVTAPFTLGGTAVAGTDFTAPSSPLVIPTGATSANLTITLLDDPTDEPDETVILTLGTPAGAVAGTPSVHTLTIVDNDAPPVVSFAAAASTAGENAGSAQVAVNLSAASAFEVSVPFTVSGTASATDATVSASPLVIPAGTTTGTVAVTLTDDTLFERDETLILTLGTPVNATAGTPARHTLTITDDEGQPFLSFAAAVSTAGEGASTVNVPLILSGPSTKDILVPFTLGGTAGEGTDYTVEANPVVIPAGSLGVNLNINLTNDPLDEADETVVISLGTPVGASAGSVSQHTLNIIDDDDPPLVAFRSAASSVAENAGTVQVEAALSAVSARDVTVPFSITGSAGAEDASILTSAIVIPAGETFGAISVSITDDSLDETDETLVFTLLLPDNALPGPIAEHTLRITDNDDPPSVILTVSAPTLLENGTGSLTVNLTLSAPSALPVTAALETSGTAAAGTDFTLSANQVTFPPGETSATLTLTAVDDNLAESEETITLSLGALTNAAPGSESSVSVTLIDDDTAKNTLAVTVSPPETPEPDGGTITFSVSLARGAEGPVSVSYALSGTASRGVDYTGPYTGTLEFTGADTTKTVSFTVLDDEIYEPAETVVLTLSNPSGGIAGVSSATAGITDNEPPPVLTISDAGTVSDAPGAARSAVFTLRLDRPSATPVTVPWRLLGGGASEGADFPADSGTVVFPPGSTHRQVTVAVLPDGLTEGLETFYLQPDPPSGAVIPAAQGNRFYLNQSLAPSATPGAFLGRSTAMDANTLVVGAPSGNDGRGEIVIFTRAPLDGLAPWAESARLTAPDGAVEDRFGFSVALWGDWLAAGAIRRDGAETDTGATYLFRRTAAGWQFVQRLEPVEGRKNSYFGWAVALHGSTLAVSARLQNTGAGQFGDEGALYVYEVVRDQWTLTRRLTVPDPGVQSLGGSLSLYGDVLAAGAPDEDTTLEDSGAVYLFGRNTGGANAWGLIKKLRRAGGPARFQSFGAAVSLWESTLAVGSGAGAGVQIFDRNAGGSDNWENTANLTWNGGVPAGAFGSALHLNGDLLAAGAPSAPGSGGGNQGSVFLFQRDSAGGWAELQRLENPDNAAGGFFGSAVAVQGGDVAAGAPRQENGAVHLFRDTRGTAFITDNPGVFALDFSSPPGGGVTLSWEPVAGTRRYVVQSSDDLLVWRDEADVLPPLTTWTAPAPTAAEPRRYFRITARF